MIRTKKKPEPVDKQVQRRVTKKVKEDSPYTGNDEIMIDTGSTLLNLAISGGRKRGGGIPTGIFVEIFGPNGSGKTALATEIAGDIQRKGGLTHFEDPEYRLNSQFANIFGFNLDSSVYSVHDTVPEVFQAVRDWDVGESKINGAFIDSLAALSTNMEMDSEEGDKMGGRRAKEFSEQLRKTCRILPKRNILMICTNQIRENMGARPGTEKYNSPGGMALGFYASLRLRTYSPYKIKEKHTIGRKEVTRVKGIETTVEVYKSSVWEPYRKVPVCIIFDYGIDDIRANLQFIKDHTKATVYSLNGNNLDKSMDTSIAIIEKEGLEEELREEVIELWEKIELKFKTKREIKKRT